jgi:hypothetical protein
VNLKNLLRNESPEIKDQTETKVTSVLDKKHLEPREIQGLQANEQEKHRTNSVNSGIFEIISQRQWTCGQLNFS